MNLPKPSDKYDFKNEAETRAQIDQRLSRTQQKVGDHEPDRLILKSPDGARWQIVVSNAGVLSATAL